MQPACATRATLPNVERAGHTCHPWCYATAVRGAMLLCSPLLSTTRGRLEQPRPAKRARPIAAPSAQSAPQQCAERRHV
eukprot:3875704-Alexandrium_andersonii.AAC.1